MSLQTEIRNARQSLSVLGCVGSAAIKMRSFARPLQRGRCHVGCHPGDHSSLHRQPRRFCVAPVREHRRAGCIPPQKTEDRPPEPEILWAKSSGSTSTFVTRVSDAEAAAAATVDKLATELGGISPDLLVFFAKGYGRSFEAIGGILQKRLGGVAIGCSSEGGVLGFQGEVAEGETHVLTALAVSMPGLEVYPFHSSDLDGLPELRRGATWAKALQAQASPTVLACACLEPGADVHPWLHAFDRVIYSNAGTAKQGYVERLPFVFGGITIGREVYLDGRIYGNGGFGAVLQAPPGGSVDLVVSTGGVPFGPWLRITGVDAATNLVTSLNGQNPRELLKPLLQGSHVPTRSGLTLAGVFVDASPHLRANDASLSMLTLAGAALQGRPSCLLRPLHSFTEDGHLLLAPLAESMPYSIGMQMQLHGFSEELAADDLISRVEHNCTEHGGESPHAAIVVSCGTRIREAPNAGGFKKALPDTPLAGFFAHAEISPVGARSYLHERTVSCLMFRSPPVTV